MEKCVQKRLTESALLEMSVFEKCQRDALAMLFLSLHHQEIVAAEILWGLWLFPLAILVYRSRFLPRFLGVWLIINGFAYLAMSFTGLLLPQYEDVVSKITFPPNSESSLSCCGC